MGRKAQRKWTRRAMGMTRVRGRLIPLSERLRALELFGAHRRFWRALGRL